MSPSLPIDRVRPLRVGILFALLAIFFGFGLGGLFGAVESQIKGHLDSEGRAVLDSAYGGDEAAMKKVTSKSWVYFKRAHLHGGAIGSAALALILLLSMLEGRGVAVRSGLATALGVGALGYAMFWMLAALRAPGMGGTGAAKESLAWLALPSAGLIIAGLVGVIVVFVVESFTAPSDS